MTNILTSLVVTTPLREELKVLIPDESLDQSRWFNGHSFLKTSVGPFNLNREATEKNRVDCPVYNLNEGLEVFSTFCALQFCLILPSLAKKTARFPR